MASWDLAGEGAGETRRFRPSTYDHPDDPLPGGKIGACESPCLETDTSLASPIANNPADSREASGFSSAADPRLSIYRHRLSMKRTIEVRRLSVKLHLT